MSGDYEDMKIVWKAIEPVRPVGIPGLDMGHFLQ